MDRFSFFNLSALVVFNFILAFCIFSYVKPYHQVRGVASHSMECNEVQNPEPERLIILLWNWPFGVRFKLDLCASEFGIYNCHLTVDRQIYDDADAVVFHYEDLKRNPNNLPQKQRPGNQYWVWYSMEPPEHCGGLERFNNVFNLTLSYRRDSDIFVPYGYLQFIEEPQNYTIPDKSKLVAWAISNWNANAHRVKYYESFRKYISIDIYGSNHKELSKENFYATVSQYKFYLAFENTLHKDYITEKIFDNSFSSGAIPVVMGPSRENYEQYLPPDSFIHVDDFKTPEELANYLKYLDQNDEAYRSYFIWRKHFKVHLHSDFYAKCNCAVCREINLKNMGYRVVKDLHKWFWS